MFIVLKTHEDGVLDKILYIGVDRTKADMAFLLACRPDPDSVTDYPAWCDTLLDEGYLATPGDGAINLIDTDGHTSDDEIASMIRKDLPKGVDKITEWIRNGEIGEVETIEDVNQIAGRLLNKSCSHDILGETIFLAENGKTYVVTVEAVAGEIDPGYLKDVLAENQENDDE